MTHPLKLSIVIPTRNRRDVLVQRTLPAIFEQDFQPDQYEVIVVVDGATDGTAEVLRGLKPQCALQILEQPNRGPSVARNLGVAKARGEVVLFLDDDIICGPDVLKRHVEAHGDIEPVVAYGAISLAPGTPASVLKYANESWYKNYYGTLNSQGGLKWPKDVYLISNSSLRRSTLLTCGGFDETMPAKEDYELGLRLWKMGIRFVYLPEILAYEYFVKRSRHFLHKDGEIYGRTEVLMCRKHPDYRPLSELAKLGKWSWSTRLRRKLIAQSPVSLSFLVALPLWVCERLCRFRVMQRAGLRFLSTGRGIVELRSEVREAGSWKALQSEFGARLPVLLYHHVGPPQPGTLSSLTVSPQRFERHVRWLVRRGYQGICPADWLRWCHEGKGLPRKPVLLTFDDGYADLVEYALPVLRRYGFGAAVYIVTGQVGGTNAWDEAQGSGTFRLMTAEQIRYWATQGIEFGAHGRTHADLRTLTSEKLKEEILGSKSDLSSLLGSRVASFAYPYGFYNQGALDCVQGAFDLAFIADDFNEGLNHLLTDPHLLRRTMVQTNDSLLTLEFRARWGRNPFGNLRIRIGLRTRLKRAARMAFGGGQ
jgi:peptidoglycan/xylan/chitin deacetylase (PgdA/CDA1 family)/glycosyltransferase involved in cell wall biosynthesis